MRTPTIPVLAALAVLACEAPKPGPQLSVRMDSTVYVRDTSGTAHANFTIVNAGNVPVRLQRCCDRLALVVDTGWPGRWVEYVGGTACLALCPSPFYRMLHKKFMRAEL